MVFYFGGQIIILIECNIRRIAKNDIEARLLSKAFEKIGLHKTEPILHAVPLRILLPDLKGYGGKVDRPANR